MSAIFTPGNIGTLNIPNRLVRSATAERMADDEGRPREKLHELYRELARGGVGLIITGHMYIHPSGKAHAEMTGIYEDALIPDLARLAETVHENDGRVVVQINHGGMQSAEDVVPQAIAPSVVVEVLEKRPVREMSHGEISEMIDAYGQAARRTKEAGFDGVQIHSAHGYLISQFLSPFSNHRRDEWGGSFRNRTRFLREVCQSVRTQVGNDYPVLIKLGIMDGVEGGLELSDGLEIVSTLQDLGIDGIEISGGFSGGEIKNTRKGIKTEADEGYFLSQTREACEYTNLPLISVGGYRSKSVIENVLAKGYVDFVSMCRPLISEPDLPNMFRDGVKDKSRCLSANNCWAENPGDGIACKCPHEKVAVES